MTTDSHQPTNARIVAIGSQQGFLHLIQTLLDSVGMGVQISQSWAGALPVVERVRPDLVILDLAPGHEDACWSTLEALKACRLTRSIPILLCPVAEWLISGHEERIAKYAVRYWSAKFDLGELLALVEGAVTPKPVAANSL